MPGNFCDSPLNEWHQLLHQPPQLSRRRVSRDHRMSAYTPRQRVPLPRPLNYGDRILISPSPQPNQRFVQRLQKS